MTEAVPENYSKAEWEHIRTRFRDSALKDVQITKLGQNVGISWPFKESDETPAKYIKVDFEDLQSIPGLIGKRRRVKTLMDILRETLAFDDPFGVMVDSVETGGLHDDTFERIFDRFRIPTNYPVELAHFAPETRKALKDAGAATLIEAVHFGQHPPPGSDATADDLRTFLNGLAHKDEIGIARHIPYRKDSGGLHLAEAIGLIAGDLAAPVRLSLMRRADIPLTGEETTLADSLSEAEFHSALEFAVAEVAAVCHWFATESAELQSIFESEEGAPERFFLTINEPERERMAVQLARLHFLGDEKQKSGLLGRLFGKK